MKQKQRQHPAKSDQHSVQQPAAACDEKYSDRVDHRLIQHGQRRQKEPRIAAKHAECGIDEHDRKNHQPAGKPTVKKQLAPLQRQAKHKDGRVTLTEKAELKDSDRCGKSAADEQHIASCVPQHALIACQQRQEETAGKQRDHIMTAVLPHCLLHPLFECHHRINSQLYYSQSYSIGFWLGAQ